MATAKAGPSDWARTQMLAGNAVGDTEIRTRFPKAGWGMAVNQATRLVREGHRIHRIMVPTGTKALRATFRLAAEGEEPWDPAQKAKGSGPSKAVPVKARVIPPPAAPELPALGSHLTVRFLLQEDDGGVTVGLVNGKYVWSVVVQGVAER